MMTRGAPRAEPVAPETPPRGGRPPASPSVTAAPCRPRPKAVAQWRGRLLIFLKDPVPGRVKTRLAAEVGDEAACQIYRACAEWTLEQLAAFQREAVICVDPPDSLERVRRWLGPPWALRPQQGAGLGDRLAEATAHAFQTGATHVVVVGTDSPWLTADDIHGAFAALDNADLVIGPTDDGGYYLIGLSRPLPEAFNGIAWSSAVVFQHTCEQVRELGARLHLLPRGYDLDYLDDVRRWHHEERRRAPHATAVQTIAKILDAVPVI